MDDLVQANFLTPSIHALRMFFVGKCVCMLFCSPRNFLFLGSLNVREFFGRFDCVNIYIFCKGMLVGYFLSRSPHPALLKSAIIHPF